jgi:glycosyltransferase involved in cell wall biosynthesis
MNLQPSFRPVVVLPTYNNAVTLLDILRRVRKQGLPIIVVNDGATDETPDILATFAHETSEVLLRVINHPHNMGKAAALQTGFQAAIDMEYTHAVTMDTDGQLDPEEMPDLLAISKQGPDFFVIGVRDIHQPDYPAKSRLGRRISNFLTRLESSAHVSDSQCGFRVYPLSMLQDVSAKSRRFGFETEIITRAIWAGFTIKEAPVSCRYFSGKKHISHFHPVTDSIRSVWMHVRLLVIAFLRLFHIH